LLGQFNVDQSLQEAPKADPWRETVKRSIDDGRRRAGQRVNEKRDRLHDLDGRIAAQVEAAIAALERDSDQSEQASAQIQAKLATLDERQRLLDQLQKRIDGRQAELDKLQAEWAEQQAAQAQQKKELTRREAELAIKEQAPAAERAKLTADRDALKDLEANLKLKEQALLAREQQLGRQRQAIARQLRASKRQMLQDIEQAEVARRGEELEALRRESQKQIDELRADYQEARRAESAALQSQIQDLQGRLTQAEAEFEQQQKSHERQIAELGRAGTAGEASSAELAKLRAELAKLRPENEQLWEKLQAAEEHAKSAGRAEDSSQDMDDLRRRFEMAVQDVRELKTQNVELSEQLAKAQEARPASAAPIMTGGGGWESLKQQLLATLDADFDDKNAVERADKLSIEGTIKITDELVAEKDREIQELQRILDSQAQQVGDVAVGAAAVSQLLDTDELVRQEREALKRLQDQLRDQLRQAELDISVERARLARERTELEEKLRTFEAEKSSFSAPGGDGADPSKKPSRRKWLARLGLGENGGEA
jgi:chromosome segregation ATPase